MTRTSPLTEAQKRYLVQCFAQHMTPAKVAAAFAKEYGITMTRQAIERYNPHARASVHMPKRLRAYFDVEREKFETKLDGMPTVQRAVRIRMREQAALHYDETGNYLAMSKVLNDIADEVGDVRTNKHVLTGKDGGPIQFQRMSDEELEAEILRMAAAKKPKGK